MKDLNSTQFFQVEPAPQIQAKDILEIVYQALREKDTIRSIRLSDILCQVILHTLQVTMGPGA